jgi:hypothetical protein
VNPVIPEAASQVAMMVMGYDGVLTAARRGQLELNAFLPLVAECLLLELVTSRSPATGFAACAEASRWTSPPSRTVQSTAAVTALVPVLGYEAACDIARKPPPRRSMRIVSPTASWTKPRSRNSSAPGRVPPRHAQRQQIGYAPEPESPALLLLGASVRIHQGFGRLGERAWTSQH